MMRKILLTILGLVMILSFSTAAYAETGTKVELGGEFQLGLWGDESTSWNDDATWAGWFSLKTTVNKDFGDNSAFLAVIVEPSVPWDYPCTSGGADFDTVYKISYGYTWKINDRWSVALGEFNDWITVTDGIIHGDDAWSGTYVWGDPGQGLTAKVDANPIDGLTLMGLIRPVQGDYLVKAAYEGDGFRIGADVNNVSSGWDGTSWDIWGEFSLFDIRFYADLCALNDPGRTVDQPYLYLVKAEYTMNPYTFKVKYANDWGDWGFYEPNTIEMGVDYDLSDRLTLFGGAAYRVKNTTGWVIPDEAGFTEHTDSTGISTAWIGASYGDWTMQLNVKTDHDNDLSLSVGYDFDDVNTVELAYDLDTHSWSITAFIDMY